MEDLSDIYMIDDNSPFTEGENNEDKNKLSDNYPEIKNDASFFSWYSYFEPQEEKYKIKYNDNEELNTINPCIPIELLISKIYKKSKIDKPWKELYNQFPYFRIINNKDNNGCYRLIMFKKMENIIFTRDLKLLTFYIIDIINNLNEINCKFEKELNTIDIKNQLIKIYTILKEKKYSYYKIEAYKKLYFYFNKTSNFDYLMILYLKYIIAKYIKKEDEIKDFLFPNNQNNDYRKRQIENDTEEELLKYSTMSAILLNFSLNIIIFKPKLHNFKSYKYINEKNENAKEIDIQIIMETELEKSFLFYNKKEYEKYKDYYDDFAIEIKTKPINLKEITEEENEKKEKIKELKIYRNVDNNNINKESNYNKTEYEKKDSYQKEIEENINENDKKNESINAFESLIKDLKDDDFDENDENEINVNNIDLNISL